MSDTVTSTAPDVGELAKRLGVSIGSLIVLHQNADPYNAERVPSRAKGAAWFAEIWKRFDLGDGVHVRRIHYILVSTPGVTRPSGKPYRNTDADWNYLVNAARDARLAGLVDPANFVDRGADEPVEYTPKDGSNPSLITFNDQPPVPHCPIDVSDLRDAEFRLPSLSVFAPAIADKYAVEIWIEKSTQNDILLPIAEGRGVTFVAGVGEISLTQCFNLVERVLHHRRPTRIFYISDFDPAGRNMPFSAARKIEYFARKSGEALDVKLIPLALTAEQVRQYRLPRVPIKDTDTRKAGFEKLNGEGAVELDALEALHPGELAKIINAAIDRYQDRTVSGQLHAAVRQANAVLSRAMANVYDQYSPEIEAARADFRALLDQAERHRQAIAEHARAIDELAERWRERAAPLWEAIVNDIEAAAPAASEFSWPEPADADEFSEPLFDSALGYLDQLARYRKHKEGV